MDAFTTDIAAVNKRVDGLAAEVAGLRERMAKLDGFMAGWRGRDRDAA